MLCIQLIICNEPQVEEYRSDLSIMENTWRREYGWGIRGRRTYKQAIQLTKDVITLRFVSEPNGFIGIVDA